MKEIRYIDRATGEVKTETPPGKGLLKFLYHNPVGKATLLPLVTRRFVSEYCGRRMDKPASRSSLQEFVDSMEIDLIDSERKLEAFPTTNDLFSRKLKVGARPIQEGFISPGDGRILAFERVADVANFYVKGQAFTLDTFLGNQELAQRYQASSIIILRLAPMDYHRFHFPWAGVPTNMSMIPGRYYSVSPLALISHFGKIFTENKRAYCELHTIEKGNVLIAPVGATLVGSIVPTFKKDRAVIKGDEMGYFAFGGSSIVLLVPKARIQLDQDLIENTKNGMETFVRMGERIGT